MLLNEYESIGVRNSQGTPQELYFEAQRTNAKVYLDVEPDNTSSVLTMVYTRRISKTLQQRQIRLISLPSGSNLSPGS
jgi:hypothetical protein